MDQPVYIKWVTNYRDTPETRQAFDIKGHMSTVKKKCEQDSAETGCMRYIALNEGEQYAVWRDDEEA